jgi:hypothetical protein
MTFNIVVFRRSLCGFVCRKVVDVVCISYCVGDHKVSLASGPLLGDSFHTPYRPPINDRPLW